MSGRTYLSIGDVLTLLREEFPDVTISKIRFLESQGLVNPERSPSGYRKFFEADVERLRWVLRQQREHFLPLKVIRDRLSEGDLGDDAGPGAGQVGDAVPQPARRNGKVPQPAHAAAAPAGSRAGGIGATDEAGGVEAGPPSRTEEQLARADDEAMARILADASRRAALIPESAGERTPLRVVGDAETTGQRPAAAAAGSVATGSVAPAPPPDPATPPGPGAGVGTGTGAGQRRAESRPPAAAAPQSAPEPRSPEPARPKATATAAVAAAPAPSAPAKPGAAAGPPPAGASISASMVTGASLTTPELCAASGLSEIELAGLQGFGLIEAQEVAGILTFNEEALTVANLAAEFRQFGIEPRHLRLYRNAVDREMGLIEQVIIPLLRQRNPESRQRAVEHADELARLGQTMRATLLRSALRHHVGG